MANEHLARGVSPARRARRRSLCDRIAAARAIGADAVGIDLPPDRSGYLVLELNGAVEFDSVYSRAGGDIYADLARAVGRSMR